MKIFEFLNTKEKRRRGAAMELAIMVMVIAVLVSGAIVSVSLIQSNQAKNAYADTTMRAELDIIGQSFCNALSNGETPELAEEYSEKYSAEISVTEAEARLILSERAGGDTVFTVSLVKNEDESFYTVTEWKYH